MKHTIIHADDNEDTRKAVKLILKSEGYNVTSVKDGKSCLKKLQEETPDLILLDMMMPDMSGWDVFQKIRKKNIGTKVAFLSVMSIEESRKQNFYKSGISDYILKPFTGEDLVKRIRKILKKTKKKKIIRGKLTIKDFIKRMKTKSEERLLSDVVINMLILQTLKKDFTPSQDIIKNTLVKLQELKNADSLYSFLPEEEQKLIKNADKNFNGLMRAELAKRFKVLVGSSTLYATLLRWEKRGIVESDTDYRGKLYKITKRGCNGRKLLLEYFLQIHKSLP